MTGLESTVTIPKLKYNELVSKANAFDVIAERERLSAADIRRLEKAKKTRLLTEEEFAGRCLG